MSVKILVGDVMERIAELTDESVHCVVTSPPYWGLRDYGTDGQLGLEATPEEHVERMVGVFREVRRVLRGDGTLWLNYGDSYAANTKGMGGEPNSPTLTGGRRTILEGQMMEPRHYKHGLKPKDLVGMPWRVAFALQADGWYLRSDIIWAKPNPMPESVTDRPTKSHEHVFLLAKSQRYHYDADAVREDADLNRVGQRQGRWGNAVKGDRAYAMGRVPSGNEANGTEVVGSETRNLRDVWTIATQPYPGAHFATFPPKLVEPCIKAGCPEDGTVLDPFGGAGTVGLVADQLGRDAVLIELNEEYARMAKRRIYEDCPMFTRVALHEGEG